jgi:hypothetical protein
MGAPLDNNNAEKWTEEEASKFVDSVYQYLKDNPKCVFIGEPLTELGYYNELWSYLSNRFEFKTIKKVESILESRIVTKGINGETNPTMSIFTLKNKYGWTDQRETKHSGEMKLPKLEVEVIDPSKSK